MVDCYFNIGLLPICKYYFELAEPVKFWVGHHIHFLINALWISLFKP